MKYIVMASKKYPAKKNKYDVNLSSIAEKVGVSAPMLGLYFAGKIKIPLGTAFAIQVATAGLYDMEFFQSMEVNQTNINHYYKIKNI